MTNTATTRSARFAMAAATATEARPGLLARLKRAYELRRALRDVYSLDDRMLRDIGLTRGQLEAAVRGER